MSSFLTESRAVEEPLIKYAHKAGWEYIPPDEALDLRNGEAGKLFYNVLRESLIKLNPQFLNERNINTLIEKIDRVSDTLEGNKENLEWLRGHKVFYDEKEKRNRNIKCIDFEDSWNNTFQVTQQWSYTNTHKTNRPDVMFLINGIPLAIVENKKPGVNNSMEEAIRQLKRLELETPEIMSYPQVFNITDALQYFYGATWNYSRKGIFNWKKEKKGKRIKEITLEEAVTTFFDKKHFLKMIKDWILFYYKENELQKTILKQHQTRAVQKIINRCNEKSKKRALIWHTQGSGKTFTMLTTTRLILESNPQATVMIIVDRNELEGQLNVWVNRIIRELKTSGVLIEHVHSKKDLLKLLKSDFRGLVISMLHKFKNMPANLCKRDNFYVFIDEAHRSIEGDLGNYLTGALPQAVLIGFTGTPIDKTSKGKGTFKVFGKYDEQGYLDKYSIAESIEDGTTVKIRHSLAPNSMRVEENLLEKEFFQIADTEGISDIEILNKILKRSVKLRTFLKSSHRIDDISKWIAKHFTDNVQPLGYKAFLVAVDREACALYKKALDKYLPEKTSKVVYTKGLNDSDLLRKYYLDKSDEKTVRKNFVKKEQDPKILIVTDKLLTGYDAPVLYCMYLDKPMRDHVLLQAISRVNRPYEDQRGRQKPCGLIVDFVGIFKSLKKTLSFDSDAVNSVIEDLNCLMQKFQSMMETDMKPYLSVTAKGADKLLEKLVYETLLDVQKRQVFFDQFKELEDLYEILSPDPKLRPYIEDYRKTAELYRIVKNTYKDKTNFIFDVCAKTEKLIQKSAELNIFSGIVKTYEINENTLKKLKENQQSAESESKQIIDLVRSIQKESEEKSRQEPYLISIAERSKQIMEEFETGQKSSKEALESAMKLAEDTVNIRKMREQSTLSHQEFNIAWPLKKQGISNHENLAVQISESFDKFKNFHSSSDEKRQLKMDMYKILSKTLPEEKLVKVSEEIINSVGEIKK